jgi:hypothetical protein
MPTAGPIRAVQIKPIVGPSGYIRNIGPIYEFPIKLWAYAQVIVSRFISNTFIIRRTFLEDI